MKKISLLLFAILFGAGVMAQTTPSVSPVLNTNTRTTKTATTSASANATSKSGTTTLKKSLKKTNANKKSIHRVNPALKGGTPATTNGASNNAIKK